MSSESPSEARSDVASFRAEVDQAPPWTSDAELLDSIADSVNPVLGTVALILPWIRRQRRATHALLTDVLTLACVALAYGGQWLDTNLRLWPRIGLDYSTHTAVFMAIASALWQHGRVWRYSTVFVGISYAALMLWQRYHSLMDIVTMAGVMLVVLVVFWTAVRAYRT